MIFNKKYISMCCLIMLSHACYTMELVEKKEDLSKFAGQVVAYRAQMYAPQGRLIQRSPNTSYPQYATYAYIDQTPTPGRSSRYVMRILLPFSSNKIKTNPKQGFELTPEVLANLYLHLQHIGSQEKKDILAELKNEQALFSKGLDKNSEKSKKIILSLVE